MKGGRSPEPVRPLPSDTVDRLLESTALPNSDPVYVGAGSHERTVASVDTSDACESLAECNRMTSFRVHPGAQMLRAIQKNFSKQA
jgi:hypothetical protein